MGAVSVSESRAASTEVSRGKVRLSTEEGIGAHFPRERRRGGAAPDEEVVGALQMFSKVDREGSISEACQSRAGTSKMPQPEQLLWTTRTTNQEPEKLIKNENNSSRTKTSNQEPEHRPTSLEHPTRRELTVVAFEYQGAAKIKKTWSCREAKRKPKSEHSLSTEN